MLQKRKKKRNIFRDCCWCLPESCLFFAAAGLHSVKSLNPKVNDGYWFRKTGVKFFVPRMLFLLLWVLKSLPDCFSWKQKILDLIMSVDFLPSFLFFCLLELGDDEPFAAAEVFFSKQYTDKKKKLQPPSLPHFYSLAMYPKGHCSHKRNLLKKVC